MPRQCGRALCVAAFSIRAFSMRAFTIRAFTLQVAAMNSAFSMRAFTIHAFTLQVAAFNIVSFRYSLCEFHAKAFTWCESGKYKNVGVWLWLEYQTFEQPNLIGVSGLSRVMFFAPLSAGI